MVVRRQPLLVLLLCLATLTVSVAGKKCRDRKTAKGCVKKREKNFCQEESSCPKPKKGGKKCKKTRKACRQTCGLCTPGVDPLTNQPINENYVAPVNTALTSMMTACSCTPTTAGSSGPQQTGDDPNSGTAPVYATVGGWDMTSGMAPPYFCVKTEYKGVDSEIAINICSAGTGALNAASCPSGMQACGRTGYPSPPPSFFKPPPPPPSPPSLPPPSSPSPPPPSPSPPPSCLDTPIADRAALIVQLGKWCAATGGVPITGKKDPLTRCAPSTWNVQSVTDMTNVIGASNCDVAEWGQLTNGVSHDDINAWDVSGVTNMEVRPPPAPRGKGRWVCLGASRSTLASLPAAGTVQRRGRIQPASQRMERCQGHKHDPNVRRRGQIQPAAQLVERRQGHQNERNV